jgi:uncharacterized protein YjiK
VPARLGGDAVDRSSPLFGLRQVSAREVAATVPEPSDLSFDPSTGSFWTVSDQTGAVYRIGSDGSAAGTPLEIHGIDLEGVALDPTTGHLFVADEANRELVEVTRDGEVVGKMAVPGKNANNLGIEGVAADPETGGFVLVNERNPAQLVFVDRAGKQIGSAKVQTEDLSAVTFTPGGKTLLVVGRFEEAVLEVDRKGRTLNRFSLGAPGVEGIAFDDRGRLIAVADLGANSRGKIYMFARGNGQ